MQPHGIPETRPAGIQERELSELYCCYCLTPKGEKYHCCQENHFVPFEDLDEDQQAEIIEGEDE